MTVIRPNSVSGITSITAQANEINFFRSNGTLAGLQLNGVNFNTTTGISTFNNLDVGGVLTYQDVTNVDSIGIITARSTIDAQGDVSIADKIIHTGDENTSIRFPSADTIRLETGGVARLTVDSSGNTLTSGGLYAQGDLYVEDSIIHTGDTNTKIRFPAADQISFETGGTERGKFYNYSGVNWFELSSTQNLSFADNGSSNRHILIGDGNASSTGALRLQAGGGSTGFGGGLTLYSHANSTNAGGVYIGKSLNSSGAIIFGNGGTSPTTEYVRINSTGEVGINVTAASGHLLHIKNGSADAKLKIESESGNDARLILDTSNGGGAGAHIDFQIDGTLKGGIQYVSNASASDTHDIVFRNTSNNERFRIDSSGRLLIGKTSGDHILDINASSDEIRLSKANLSDYTGIQLDRDASGNAGGYIGLAGNTNHYINGSAQHDICVRSQANLLFSTNGADERFRISASGHAVFGASSFGAAGSFGIEQDGNVRSVLASGSTGDTLFGAISGVSNGFQINVSGSNDQLYRFHSGSQISMQIDSSGRVTKPLTPSFHVYNVSGTQNTVLTFSNTHHNNGNHMNASTGTFTCPVAGRYLFTFAFLHSSGPTTYARVLFRINGTRSTTYGDTLCDDTGLYLNTSMSMIFNLSANDTVTLFNEGNNTYSSQYGAFSGILLA